MTIGAGPDYHPSEQSFRSLRRELQRASFRESEVWLEGTYPVHRIFGESRVKTRLLPFFRRYRWLKELFAGQLFAVATKIT